MPSAGDKLRAFEGELGLTPGFLQSIRSDDDWSLVIKLHALVEAALAHLLAETLGHPDLLEVFSRLELSNQRTGKLAFARTLACVSEDDRRFISRLSELRNTLVHDVRNTTFSLTDWVAKLDSHQLRNFADAFCARRPAVPDHEQASHAIGALKADPQRCIWGRTIVFAYRAYETKSDAQRFHWENQMLREGLGVDDDE